MLTCPRIVVQDVPETKQEDCNEFVRMLQLHCQPDVGNAVLGGHMRSILPANAHEVVLMTKVPAVLQPQSSPLFLISGQLERLAGGSAGQGFS